MSSLEDLKADPRFQELPPDRQQRIIQAHAATTPPTPPTSVAPVPGALKVAQEWVGQPLAMAGAGALAAPLAGAAAAIPGVGPAAAYGIEAGAMGAGNAIAAKGFELANRAMGYTPPKTDLTGEAVSGALVKPMGQMAGAVWQRAVKPAGRAFLGITGTEKLRAAAAEKVRSTAAIVLPMLHDKITDVMYSLHDWRTKAGSAAAKSVRSGFRSFQRDLYEDILSQGGSPELTQAAAARAAMDIPSAVQARGGTRDVLRDLYGRIQKRFGQQYEALYGPHRETEMPMEAAQEFGRFAQQTLANAENYESMPSELRAKLARVARYAEGDPRDRARAQIMARFGNAAPRDPAAIEEAITAQLAAEGQEELKPLTVGQLLGMKGDVRRYLDHARGPTRHVASAVTDEINSTLGRLGVPGSPELNAEYNLWRNRFTPQSLRALQHGEAPEDFRALLQTKRFGALVAEADPDERAALRHLVSSYARRTNMGPDKFARMLPGEVLGALYGQGAQDAGKWLELNARTATVERMLDASPQLRRSYAGALQAAHDATLRKAAGDIKEHVIAALGKLDSAAGLRERLAAMSPEAVAEFYATEMRKPQFLASLMGEARRSIDLPTKGKLRTLFQYGRWPAATMAAGLITQGHVTSPYVVGGMAMSGASMARAGMQHLFHTALESPRAMAMLNKLLEHPQSAMAMKMLGRYAGQAVALNTLRQLNDPPESPSRPGEPELQPGGQRAAPGATQPVVPDQPSGAAMGELQRLGMPIPGADRQVHAKGMTYKVSDAYAQQLAAEQARRLDALVAKHQGMVSYQTADVEAQRAIMRQAMRRAKIEALREVRRDTERLVSQGKLTPPPPVPVP